MQYVRFLESPTSALLVSRRPARRPRGPSPFHRLPRRAGRGRTSRSRLALSRLKMTMLSLGSTSPARSKSTDNISSFPCSNAGFAKLHLLPLQDKEGRSLENKDGCHKEESLSCHPSSNSSSSRAEPHRGEHPHHGDGSTCWESRGYSSHPVDRDDGEGGRAFLSKG